MSVFDRQHFPIQKKRYSLIIPGRINVLTIGSVDEIRSNFPALKREHAGYLVAYFDGPGGTQVSEVVVEAMVDYLRNHKVYLE